MEYAKERFVRENFTDIMLAFGKDVETKVSSKLEEKFANPKSLEDKLKPKPETVKEDAEFNAWASEGMGAPEQGKPIFGN